MSILKITGIAAIAAGVLGYGGFVALLVLARLDYLERGPAIALSIGSAVIGEIGLWVGAGCLGLTLFKRRKALFDRVFGRKPETRDAAPNP